MQVVKHQQIALIQAVLVTVIHHINKVIVIIKLQIQIVMIFNKFLSFIVN